MTIELTTTGRDGALTKFRITNAASLWDDFPGTGYSCDIDGDDIVGRGSKGDIRKLESWIARQSAPQAVKSAPAATNQPRRVLVPFGSVKPGDEIAGRIVRGLGRDFYPNPDQFSQWGIDPSYSGTVQYAYFD
jgi:hypothetical protein